MNCYNNKNKSATISVDELILIGNFYVNGDSIPKCACKIIIWSMH